MTTSKKSKCTNKKIIYVGPNFPDSKLTKYTVFVGGQPSWLKEEFDNDIYGKELSRLFVPVEKLSDAQNEIQTKGKPLYKYYRKVVDNI